MYKKYITFVFPHKRNGLKQWHNVGTTYNNISLSIVYCSVVKSIPSKLSSMDNVSSVKTITY